MVSNRTRRSFHLFVGAVLTFGTPVIGSRLTPAVTAEQPWLATLGWGAAGLIVTFFYLRWQLRSGEESPDAIKAQVDDLESKLRSQVQSRSYGARSKLIAAPLKELDLDITPCVGWVRDPRLVEPEPISEKTADIVAAFESSKRRPLIVGEPGSGKTTAAYALIEHLDETEGDERIPLLVNLSAWEAQENFEAFLVDYLCSEVGYQVRMPVVANAFVSSRRYSLVLDGLDEIPARLREHFSERLDEFVRGLPGEVAVVVTCRTQEYEELFAAHPTGLGLVQAVEILPLTGQQLDGAFVALARFDDEEWEIFLTQRHLMACQRARNLLSNPLFLNLAVADRIRPRELLNRDEEVLHGYFSFAIALEVALYGYGTILTGRRRHEILLVPTVAGFGLALGTLWMVEWVYDSITPSNSILGKQDTMIDLTMDLIGGVVAGLVGLRMLRKRGA